MIHLRNFALGLCLAIFTLQSVGKAQVGADRLPGGNAPEPAAADTGEELISPDSPAAEEAAGIIGFRSLPVFPGDPQLPARQAWEAGLAEEALTLARQHLRENADSIEARLILADTLDPMFYRREILKLYEDARQLVEQSPQEQPAALEPFLDMKLALTYQALDQNDKAEPLLRKVAENYKLYTPTLNGRVFNALGHVFEARDRQEEANLAFKTAAEQFGSEAARAHLEHQQVRQEIRDLGL